ncbi:MAG TPA: carbon storage regulator CsrA [Kineosporiaceae bacterium]|nr:carbon storage regulator CsrA [Kineosporiaceae bacterium]
MLVLTRRAGESIVIGDDVRVVVLDVRGETVRLGIEAPRSVQVHRAEVYAEVQAANAAALAPPAGDLGPLAGHLSRLARPRTPADRRPGRRTPVRSPDAVPPQGRTMVVMTEGDQRLQHLQEEIDQARAAAAEAEPDLLPQTPSPADRVVEGSGEHEAGSPSEGPDAGPPGEVDVDR